MAKLLYRPFGLLLSVLGGLLAGAAFKQIWKRVSGKEDPPKAKESEYGLREILPAVVLEGALFGLVNAAVDPTGARTFEKLTGSWPADWLSIPLARTDVTRTTAQSDRGRAEDATELPGTAWAAVLKRTVTEFKEDGLTDWAAALTYYGILSIFPALLVAPLDSRS